jgi:hypothetical protein
MDLMDLVNRRQVLVNLISRVGRGQQNIYRWVDELMEIDAQIECQEQVQKAKKETVVIELIKGTKVVHPRWGEGTVFAVMGKMVSVDFPGMGRKLVSDTSELVSDTSALKQVQSQAPIKSQPKRVDKLQNKPQVQSQAPIKSQPKRVDKSLEVARQQLLALGVLEESILIQDGLVVVLGADCREHEGKSFYWDRTVFSSTEDANVRINPVQVKNSQRKAWEGYKAGQGKKPSQPFEKWLSGRLTNLPKLSNINKIDAEPASIWIKEDKVINKYVLLINRTSRHVQELSAAIRHEMNGKDNQDGKLMVFLDNQEEITLASKGSEGWKLTTHVTLMKKEGDTKKEFYVKDEVFAPIMEKINVAALKCGDSFKMPFGLRVM